MTLKILALTVTLAASGYAAAQSPEKIVRPYTGTAGRADILKPVHPGTADVIKEARTGDLAALAATCEDQKFEVRSEADPAVVEFAICADDPAQLLAALEKAEAGIVGDANIQADRKDHILAQIRTKIGELRRRG